MSIVCWQVSLEENIYTDHHTEFLSVLTIIVSLCSCSIVSLLIYLYFKVERGECFECVCVRVFVSVSMNVFELHKMEAKESRFRKRV